MPLIKDINTILHHGNKSTSYKYAFLTSLFDYVIEFPSEVPRNNFHFIPLMYVAKQFFTYYYPLSILGFYKKNVGGSNKAKIISLVEEFQDKIKEGIVKCQDLSRIQQTDEFGVLYINRWLENPQKLPEEFLNILVKIRRKIIQQPLKFVSNVKGEKILFFGLFCTQITFDHEFNDHLNAAAISKFSSSYSWLDLLLQEDSFLIIDDYTYKNMVNIRFWGREVIIKSWIEYILHLKPGSKPNIPSTSHLEHVIDIFNLNYTSIIERDPVLIQKYRDLYQRLNLNNCIYTGEKISPKSKIHLDHFLPWCFYPVNRFWNLFPSSAIINLRKSSNLVSWNEELEKNIAEHLKICINAAENEPVLKEDLNYYYKIIQKNRRLLYGRMDKVAVIKGMLEYVKIEWKRMSNIIPGCHFQLKKP